MPDSDFSPHPEGYDDWPPDAQKAWARELQALRRTELQAHGCDGTAEGEPAGPALPDAAAP
jgi:hypothetical protein